jgi:hypothetical protein
LAEADVVRTDKAVLDLVKERGQMVLSYSLMEHSVGMFQ